MFACMLTEVYTIIAGRVNDDRLPAYHIYSVVESILLTRYFFITIGFRKTLVLGIITILYVAIASINIIYFQPLRHLNSNYITFNCLIGIPMALYSLYKILIDDTIEKVQHHVHFWFWVCFFMYYSSSFFFWQFVGYFYRTNRKFYSIALDMHSILNVLTYAGILITMLFYPKKPAQSHG